MAIFFRLNFSELQKLCGRKDKNATNFSLLLHRIVFVPEECLVSSEDSSEGSSTDRESPSESLKLSDIHGEAGQEDFS